MRKIIVVALLLMLIATPAMAADWSKYESGRDNIRLDGYQGQPGYIAFTDGNGFTRGYVYMTAKGGLMVVPLGDQTDEASTGALDLSTTKLTTQGYKVTYAGP